MIAMAARIEKDKRMGPCGTIGRRYGESIMVPAIVRHRASLCRRHWRISLHPVMRWFRDLAGLPAGLVYRFVLSCRPGIAANGCVRREYEAQTPARAFANTMMCGLSSSRHQPAAGFAGSARQERRVVTLISRQSDGWR